MNSKKYSNVYNWSSGSKIIWQKLIDTPHTNQLIGLIFYIQDTNILDSGNQSESGNRIVDSRKDLSRFLIMHF